jgi:hypothetical protein
MTVKVCKKCAKVQPTYGFTEAKKTEKYQRPDYDKIKDPLIGGNEKIFVSTMKMKGE